MRINAEAVICTKNGEWYHGSMSGFHFYPKHKIKSKDYFKDPARFISINQWIKDLGYKRTEKLSKTLLKSIILRDSSMAKQMNLVIGVKRVFIGRTMNIASEDYKDYNLLCANCIWTCKQSKSLGIQSCKAFQNDTPI